MVAEGVGGFEFTTGSFAFLLRCIAVRGGVAKTLFDRQLVHLRRELMCSSSFIVAIKRRSVGFVDEFVSVLGPLNRALYVFLVYLLSGRELAESCAQFAMPFSQFAMPFSQLLMPFSKSLRTRGGDFIRQLDHETDRSADMPVDWAVFPLPSPH